MRYRMAMASALAALLAACGGGPAAGGDTTVIEVARLFDGERAVDDARIVVRGERIVAAGPRGAGAVPDGARVVDHRTRFAMPGLISAHAHVGTVSGSEHGGRYYSADTVRRDLAQFGRYGVVAVNALGLNRPQFHALRRRWHGNGHGGASLYGAGAGIGTVGGVPPEGAMGVVADQVVRPETPEAARAAVRAMAAAGVDMVKLWLDPAGGTAPRMPPAIYRAVIDEAHRRRLPVAAHIHDLADARALAEAGIDVIAHGVRDRPVDDGFVALMRARGVWYVPTIAIDEAEYIYAANPGWLNAPFVRAGIGDALAAQIRDPAWRRDALADAADARRAVATNIANLARMHAGGVRVAMGTDAGATALRVPGLAEHRELELMARAGLPPAAILAAATTNAAAMIGAHGRGRIAPGHVADLLILDADPLRDVRATRLLRETWRAGTPAPGPGR